MGSRSQNLISSFPCLNNIAVQVWSNLFIHSGDRMHTQTNHFPTNLSSPVTLKMGSRSPKSFTCPSIVDVQVWSKSIHSYKRQGADKPFSNNLSPPVTMGSRSPKSNQFFYMSQQYSCASLVKIYSFLQEIGCGQAIIQQSKPSCDLENGVKVTKI